MQPLAKRGKRIYPEFSRRGTLAIPSVMHAINESEADTQYIVAFNDSIEDQNTDINIQQVFFTLTNIVHEASLHRNKYHELKLIVA